MTLVTPRMYVSLGGFYGRPKQGDTLSAIDLELTPVEEVQPVALGAAS